jgi:hypothetical protein
VLAILKFGKGGNMFDVHCRPAGRLFYLLAFVMVGLGVSWGQSPSTTTVSDVVYRADGGPAGGTLLISWPTFSTAAGQSVAASDPNANAQPSGGTPLAAAAVLPGSTASEIVLGAGVVDVFSDGDMLAVDADYQQQTGYVGTGISAAYVNDPADVNRDPNYGGE